MVFILISNGLPTPCWEQYIPTTDTVFFDGEKCHIDSLCQYAERKNIPVYIQTPSKPSTVLAFWNGKADKVDEILCDYPSDCVHLFLLAESGRTFEEYRRSI